MPRMPPSTDDLAEADDELWAALLHADADAIEAIADAESSIDLPAIGAASLEDLLADLRRGRLRLTGAEFERRRLRITGELATVTAVAQVSGTREGAPIRARLRWITTWRLEAAGVRVAASASPLRDAGGDAAGRR